MKNILILIIVSTYLLATGDPYAKITLTPLATKDDMVLFATKSVVNKTGSYSCFNESYGWLVVSTNGSWDEQWAFNSMNHKCEEVNATKHKLYENGYLNLKNLNEELLPYGFDENSTLTNERYSILELKKNQSCFKGECIERTLKQRSIENYRSTTLVNPIRSSFFYGGIALFHNFPTKGQGEESVLLKDEGALFDIGLYSERFQKSLAVKEPKSSVDALVVFNPKEFKQTGKRTPLKNILNKVNAQKSFYGYCFHMYHNDCFMQEDFKIHGFSNDLIAYTIYEGMDDAVENEYESFLIQNLTNNQFKENIDIEYSTESFFKNHKYNKTKKTEKVSSKEHNYEESWYYKFDVDTPNYGTTHASSKTEKLLKSKLKKYDVQESKNLYVYDFPFLHKGKKIEYKAKQIVSHSDMFGEEIIEKVEIFSYKNGIRAKKVFSESFKNSTVLAYEVLGYLKTPNDKSKIILVLSYLNRGWEGVPHVTHFKFWSVKL